MFKLETIRSAHALDRLADRWQWLVSSQPWRYTLFQQFELNRLAAAWFSQRESPNIVVAESDAGLAIIPAVRREREVGLIGETLFDYRDVLSAGDPAILAAAWQELARAGLPLEVTALRGEQARERWQRFQPAYFCNAPATRGSEISAAEFVRAHHKSAKASRRLAREGLRLTREAAGAREAASWLYRRKTEWQGTSANLFLDPLRREFMQTLIDSGASCWNTWRYTDFHGAIAAAMLTLDHRQTRHFYTIHHDPRWERLSPGEVLIFDVTRETLAEGMDVDFMTGEYPYKNRLATAQVPLYKVAVPAAQMQDWNEQRAA